MWIITIIAICTIVVIVILDNKRKKEAPKSNHIEYINPVEYHAENGEIEQCKEGSAEEIIQEYYEAWEALRQAITDFDDDAVKSIENSISAISDWANGIGSDEGDNTYKKHEQFHTKPQVQQKSSKADDLNVMDTHTITKTNINMARVSVSKKENAEKRKKQEDAQERLNKEKIKEEKRQAAEREKKEKLREIAIANSKKDKWEPGDIISYRDLPHGTYLYLCRNSKQTAKLIFHDNIDQSDKVERSYYLGTFTFSEIDGYYRNYITVKSGALFRINDETFNIYGLIKNSKVNQEQYYKHGVLLYDKSDLIIKLYWHSAKKILFYSDRVFPVYEQTVISVAGIFFWVGLLPGEDLHEKTLCFYNKTTKRSFERGLTSCMLDIRQQNMFLMEYQKVRPDAPKELRFVMCVLPDQLEIDQFFLDMIKDTSVHRKQWLQVTEQELHDIKIKKRGQVEAARLALVACEELGFPRGDYYPIARLQDMDPDELELLERLGVAAKTAKNMVQKIIPEGEVSFVVPTTYNKKYYCAAALASSAKSIEATEKGFKITYSTQQLDEIGITYHLLCPSFDESPEDDEELYEAFDYLLSMDPIFYLADQARGIRGSYYDAGGQTCLVTDYLFSLAKFSAKRFKGRIDEIYNELLEKKDVLPRWSSEFSLYMLIKDRVGDVIYQYRPRWLEPQSIDIFLSESNIGIEYQGIQHYEPIERFGGEEGFRATQARDNKKRALCKQNLLNLIEWPYTKEISAENVEAFLVEQGVEIKHLLITPENVEEQMQKELIPVILKKKEKEKDHKEKAPQERIPQSVIRQYDTSGVFVADYKTMQEAAVAVGISKSSVNKAVTGERAVSGGYQWRRVPYGAPPDAIGEIIPRKEEPKAYGLSEAKEVRQYTLDGVFVAEYASIGLATKSAGISRKCITDAINGKQKTAGGYIWKFADTAGND